MCNSNFLLLCALLCRAVEDTYSTAEWAKKKRTRGYGRRLVAKDDIVFEWDPKRLKSGSNPGYGVAVGRVIDPHGATLEVEWRDGERGFIERTKVRPAPKVGTVHDDKRVVDYTPTGVVLEEESESKDGESNGRKIKKRRGGKKRGTSKKRGSKKKQSEQEQEPPSSPANEDSDSDEDYKPPKKKSKTPSPTKWKQRAVRAKPKRYNWRFTEDGEKEENTSVLLPGPVYDCVFKRIVLDQGEDTTDKSNILLEDETTRSKMHLRAVTTAEFERENTLL